MKVVTANAPVLGKADHSYTSCLPDLLAPKEPICVSRAMELSWCAGFVDGEGCISVVWQRYNRSDRRPTIRIRFELAQNHLPSLQRVARILGGDDKIYPMKHRMSYNKPMYALSMDGARALSAVAQLQPYLIRKKYEADFLLASVERCWLGNHPGPKGYPAHVWAAREQLVKKLQRLK